MMENNLNQDPSMMENNLNQDSAAQENLMADGPVSRGASNKSAPTNQNQPATPGTPGKSTGDQDTVPPYNKMVQEEGSGPMQGTGMGTDQTVGSPAGGTLPAGGTRNSPGGRATSNSTVSAGGSSGGAVVGQGSTTDRGSMSDTDMNATTNTADKLDLQSQATIDADQLKEGNRSTDNSQ